jgi:hypothetical protein
MNHISLIGISEIELFQIYEYLNQLKDNVHILVVFDYQYLFDMNHHLYYVNMLTKLN